jgi:hypothetical protein
LTAPPPVAAPAESSGDTPSIIRQTRYDNGMFPNMARAFTPNGQPRIPAGDVESVIQPFSFRPDLALRSKLRDKMLSNYGQPGTDIRKQSEATYPANDPFRLAAPFAAQYGLSFDNAVDAAFAAFEAYRRQGAAQWQPPTAAQAALARKQIAGAMARDPIFKIMKAADLQTASDDIWFMAVTNISIEQTMTKLGRKTEQQFRDNISGMHEKLFGFSIVTLRLTDQGYVK